MRIEIARLSVPDSKMPYRVQTNAMQKENKKKTLKMTVARRIMFKSMVAR